MKISKDRTSLADNIIYHRKKLGLTQNALADLAGVSRRMIAYYETKPATPPIDVIAAIAKALTIKIEDLIGQKVEKKLESEFLNVDARTLKKIKQILSLPRRQRHKVYEYVDLLISKGATKKAS
jgi:transcriptional regulator with XRE-family HTH domain